MITALAMQDQKSTRLGPLSFSARRCAPAAGVTFGALLARAVATERKLERKWATDDRGTLYGSAGRVEFDERERSATPSENGDDVNFPLADNNMDESHCVGTGKLLDDSSTSTSSNICQSSSMIAPPSTPSATRPKRELSAKAKTYQKNRGKMRKLATRLARKENRSGPPCATVSVARRAVHAAVAVKTAFMLKRMRVTRSAWLGIRSLAKYAKRAYSLSEMCGADSKYKMRKLCWDGLETIVIHDGDGRIFAVLGGRPRSEDWEDVIRGMADAIEEKRPHLSTAKGDRSHRRGDFTALRMGIIHGNGTKHPTNADLKANTEILSGLYARDDFCRVSRHTEVLFQVWVPKLHARYSELMARLQRKYPGLKPNFDGTVFAASTLNFGPATQSFPHVDFNNLSFGICSVTALGDFDHTRGGHLILWDLDLVVEFPAGATILLPSAVLRHSNTAIQSGEKRYSYTQYTSGGLFRWVEHGFRSETKYMASLNNSMKKEEEEIAAKRWDEGMDLYSTIDELKKLWAKQ
ncbi:hypothetical protein HWV62_1190 [Athelia sp. TMB]|nr:hypothetical protein HWV62_1190 [Athelia sp. TMB]